MPSRSNPNTPSKQRRKASRVKVQKRKVKGQINKNNKSMTSANTLLPSSGPLAPKSGKKARKLARAQNQARQRVVERAMIEEAEVVMTDAPNTTKSKRQYVDQQDTEQMVVDL